jgi:predicted nucleotidyltransferase
MLIDHMIEQEEDRIFQLRQKFEEEKAELLQKLEDSEKAKNIYRSIIQFLMNGSVIGSKR